MTLILTTTGILTALTIITGTAALMAAVALTDIHGMNYCPNCGAEMRGEE